MPVQDYPEAVRLSGKNSISICSLFNCTEPTAYKIIQHPKFPEPVIVEVPGTKLKYSVWITREVLAFRDSPAVQRTGKYQLVDDPPSDTAGAA